MFHHTALLRSLLLNESVKSKEASLGACGVQNIRLRRPFSSDYTAGSERVRMLITVSRVRFLATPGVFQDKQNRFQNPLLVKPDSDYRHFPNPSRI